MPSAPDATEAGGAQNEMGNAMTGQSDTVPEVRPDQPEPVDCIRVAAQDDLFLLQTDHSIRAEPSDLVVHEIPGVEIGMTGVLTSEARLVFRFKRCYDLSQVPILTFMTRRGPSDEEQIALDSPSNLRPPEGACVGQYCYSPYATKWLGPDNGPQVNWSELHSGSPSPLADPAHVLGFTWTIKGEVGEQVDLAMTDLYVSTLR